MNWESLVKESQHTPILSGYSCVTFHPSGVFFCISFNTISTAGYSQTQSRRGAKQSAHIFSFNIYATRANSRATVKKIPALLYVAIILFRRVTDSSADTQTNPAPSINCTCSLWFFIACLSVSGGTLPTSSPPSVMYKRSKINEPRQKLEGFRCCIVVSIRGKS